jgi:hypothetical protein
MVGEVPSSVWIPLISKSIAKKFARARVYLTRGKVWTKLSLLIFIAPIIINKRKGVKVEGREEN